VSLQLVLRAGPAAFTWKTAYDEAQHDFSPGMLLLEDYTAAFLADPGIARVDSCAYDETSFMGAWRERQAVATVWLDARREGSSAFAVLTRLQRAYLRARGAAKAAYLTYLKKRTR
jgi:Acetyltransferase (GNAT) domain